MGIPDDLAVALARLGALRHSPDADIKPVLLRVAVDLFVQKPHHAPAELRIFEAMAGPLLDDADPDTKRVVMEKLSKHPEAPIGLIDRLVDEQNLIAAETYRLSPLDEPKLLAAAQHGTVGVATMVAHRQDLPRSVIRALAGRAELRIAMALVANRDAALDREVLAELIRHARHDRDLADRLAERAINPIDLVPLFPMVSAEHRRRMIDAIRRLHLGRRPWGRPDGATADMLDRLDRLVLYGEWDSFDHALCLALGVDEHALRPLLHDGSGDILALALAAAGASPEMAARAFILGDPAIGRSVAAVRRLTGMVEALSPSVARRLIDAMITGTLDEPRRPVLPGKPTRLSRRPDPAEAAPQRREPPSVPLRQHGS